MSVNEGSQYSDASDGDVLPSGAQQRRPNRVRAVSVKAPVYNRANPALWFVQMEAYFEISQIRSDRSKYNAIVATIDSLVIQQMSDIFLNPPETQRYLPIKNRVLERYAAIERTLKFVD